MSAQIQRVVIPSAVRNYGTTALLLRDIETNGPATAPELAVIHELPEKCVSALLSQLFYRGLLARRPFFDSTKISQTARTCIFLYSRATTS